MRVLPLSLLMLGACGQQQAATNTIQNVDNAADGQGSQAAAPAPAAVTFHDVARLTKPRGLEGQLRGGRPATPQEWPASFYILAAGKNCTATIVGEKVLITAAHCVPNGGRVALEKNNQPYYGTCRHAPEYGSGRPYARTADYALCALDVPVPGVAAEHVNTKPQVLGVGTEILLTGFGCTTNAGTGGNNGVYIIGEEDIYRLPSGDNNDITTRGDVGVCFGDSGGPAFLIGPGKKRVQVSVNSRVQDFDPSEEGADLGPESYLSSLTSAAGDKFLREWSNSTGLKICGRDSAAVTCRQQ